MDMSILDIAIESEGALPLEAAQDGPTPLRKIPSARAKAAICFPMKRVNMIRTLYAGTRPIKDCPAW